MSIRFQKRVSIFPGFRLNFSASGVSATIGMRGASVTLGGRGGPMANLGIPGSGLSTRFSLFSKPTTRPNPTDDGDESLNWLRQRVTDRIFGRTREQKPVEPAMTPIGSAATSQLSSPHLLELRDLIATAHARHSKAEIEVSHRQAETGAKTKAVAALNEEVKSLQSSLRKWQNSRVRFLYRRKIRNADKQSCDIGGRVIAALDSLAAARTSLQEAENTRDESWLDGSFPLSGPASAAWSAVVDAFHRLSACHQIWDLTAERRKIPGAERSSATHVLERKPTQLSIAQLPFFAPDFSALCWHNANGDDLYLYPGLLLVVHDASNFAVIDLKAVKIGYELSRFVEREELPADGQRIDSAWQYSNKDGTPDLRYRENQEYPVMMYGEFRFSTETGLDECFMFSNIDATSGFSNAMLEFEKLLGR